MGKGIVDRLKKEFQIADRWLPFEIHPDTPVEGVLWRDYFPGMNPDLFFQQLDDRGKKMGVRFGPQPLMSNSRLAMEGGEFAKAHGRYDAYHAAVFRAYFTDCKDIGDRSVILELAKEVELDVVALDAALEGNIYLPHLVETRRDAKANGFSAAPTFVIEGYGALSGAQPLDTFRDILRG
ncbi:MAG: DsbA family protein [Desulfosarcinaceae bacterium]|nr:DsbA family protein [Desulfosarcinaceae bacterium]